MTAATRTTLGAGAFAALLTGSTGQGPAAGAEISIRDAQLLAGIIDSKMNEAWYQPFIGGLGIYGSTPSHGPFVHLDVRGYKALW